MENIVDSMSDVKFENTESFEMMVITPNNIESYDYNNPGYITKLINEDFTKIVEANPENFMEKIAENFNIALLFREVVFEFIRSEQALWKSFARYAVNKIKIGPNIASGKIHPKYCILAYAVNPIIIIIIELIIKAEEFIFSVNFSNFFIISILVIFLRKSTKWLNIL